VCLFLVPPLLILVYPGCGIALSRFIGRRIIWWEFTANIHNVAADKLRTILTWPLSVPVFIVKLFIAKIF